MPNKHEPSFEEPVAGNLHGGFCEELSLLKKDESVYSMTKLPVKTFISLALILICQIQCTSNFKRVGPHGERRHHSDSSLSQDYILFPSPQMNLQGLSGLVFKNETKDHLYFWTMTDRGPNLDPIKKEQKTFRPFLDPQFNPKIYLISIHKATQLIQTEKVIQLQDQNGALLSGLPPCGSPVKEEIPIDRRGQSLPCDPNGVDPESLAIDDDGNFWIGEEYRPAIIRFSPHGKMEKAFIPEKSEWKLGAKAAPQKERDTAFKVYPILPKSWVRRQPNRGIEGLAISKQRLFAILQSPLPRNTSESGNFVDLAWVDIHSDKLVKELRYPMNTKEADKIGDMTFMDPETLLVIEQNSKMGPKSFHKIFKVKLPTQSSELMPGLFLAKELFLDLVASNYLDYEKVEGLTVIDQRHLAVVNDNDFGVHHADEASDSKLSIFKITTSLE